VSGHNALCHNSSYSALAFSLFSQGEVRVRA
jgi:hypothetical protein